MKTQKLEQNWTLTILGENVYHIPEEPIPAKVPSTVYGTLLEQGLMPDPFYRDNELDATRLMENDFAYETDIRPDAALRKEDRIFLRFEGIDTIAEISLDGSILGTADNMNRVYEFDITEAIKAAPEDKALHLRVLLHSPNRFIRKAYAEDPIGGSPDAMPGFPHIRKAACMFGWDWGPRLPDAGLFRPVSLVGYTGARISEVLIRQIHHVTGKTVQGNLVDRVDLAVDCEAEWLPEAADTPVVAEFVLTFPDGARLQAVSTPAAAGLHTAPSENLTGLTTPLREDHLQLHLAVENPKLWWPNGYGEQPLYRAEVFLHPAGKETVLDAWTKRIGLRTVSVNTDPILDEQHDPHMRGQKPDYDDGRTMFIPEGGDILARISRDGRKVQPRNFAITVNGLAIFAMGADYIPEDNILTRQSRERTDLLLSSAKEAHYNCMRIWGGGYFCDDFVYDLCDEKGILVWQDLMFSCAAYELDAPFQKNITMEIRQNIRRLRSHPCLALWCGNNEMETQYESWAWPVTKKQYYDYIRIFECLIPEMVHEEDPDAFYWPSSPSSGGNFENSNEENVGDTHYWGVWHGSEPFTAYRNHHYRFLSEFGFQSFPAVQTIRRFTLPQDRNIFSRVMEMHQRNSAANGKILNYLSQTYLYPKDFEALVYCSQLLQADAIRYGVEHFRRFRGTCMGTIVWQLNDIWPVASWSSLDYYGNWKALHYAEKRMFAPVLLSCEEHGEIDQKPFPNSLPKDIDVSADLHVANETRQEITCTVHWSLRNPDSSVVMEGRQNLSVPAFGGVWLPHLDFNGQDPLSVHLSYALEIGGSIVSEGTSLFCAPKHYHFLDPELTVRRKDDTITVTAKAFAKAVSVETDEGVLRLDDNFVDMEAGERMLHVLPGRDFKDPGDLYEGKTLRVRSVYETAGH